MKSKSLEMILDNMYFIASVDEKEEKVFVALDFEEAGRKYAELKSEGDAIIWHLKKKKLGSRDSACEILCDFGTPIEMVTEERLLRLVSLVVVEGKDSPSVRPTVESGEVDRFKKIFYKPNIPHYQCDRGRVVRRRDIPHLIGRTSDELQKLLIPLEKLELFWQFGITNKKTTKTTSFIADFDPKKDGDDFQKRVLETFRCLGTVDGDEENIVSDEYSYESEIMEAIEKYNMNPEEVQKDVARMEKIIIKTVVLAGKEDIGVRAAHILSIVHHTSKIALEDIYKRFREIMAKDENKDNELKAHREKLAARAVAKESLELIKKDQNQIEMSSKHLEANRYRHIDDKCIEIFKAMDAGRAIEHRDLCEMFKDTPGLRSPNTVKNRCERLVDAGLIQKEKGTENIQDADGKIIRYRNYIMWRPMPDPRCVDDLSLGVTRESDQRSAPRDLVDGWKERQEDPESILKAESSVLEKGEKEWSKKDLIAGISEILKHEKGPMSRKDIISKVIDIDSHNIPLHASNLFNIPIKFLIDHSFINRVSRGMYKWIGLGKSYESGLFESFLGDWCFLLPKGVTIKRECWDAYLVYCQQRDLQPISEKIFSIEMKRRNIKIRRRYLNNTRETVWIGLDLVPEERRVYLGEEPITHERDGSKSIPSVEVLLEEFDDRCKMRGMTKKSVRRYVSYAKDFLEFVEESGEFISDVDERTLEAFKSHLRDVRGFKKGTIGVYFAAIRAFYDYTNFKGITDVSEPISHGAEGAKLIPSIPGLLEGFADNCELKGTNKKDVCRRTMQARVFIDFVKGNSGSILEVDEQTLEGYKSYLKDDRGFKEATIESHSIGIRAFYDYTNSKGFTDVSIHTKQNRSISRKVSEVTDEVSQYPKSVVEGWVKRAVEGDHLTVVCKIDISKKPSKPWLISIYEELNQSILRKIEEMGGRVKRVDLMRSILRIFKPDTIPNTPIIILRAHLKYLLEHGFLKRPEKGIYALPSDEEKSTDQYPRTHLGWAERAVGKDGDLSRMHIDMSNESFEPNFRYIYKGVVEEIIHSIQRVWKRDLYSPLIVGNESWNAYLRKDEVVREVLNIPEGNEIPSGASFFIQVHLKFMVEHDFAKRIEDGTYVVSESVYQKGTIQKWNQIPREEKSPSKALKGVARIASETMDGEEHGHQKRQRTEKDWVREILGDDLQRVDIENLKDADGKEKNWRTLYTGINQKILLELENKTSMPRSELTRLLFDFEGNIPKAVRNIMDVHLRYLVYQGYILSIQTGVYRLVDDSKGVVTEKTSLPTTKNEKTSHRELSAEDWIRRITKGEKPYTWISYGSMDDTRVVQRGQGTPIYSEINRRIMVEVRASKDPVKRSELIRPVFDLGWDKRIPRVVNTILNNHLRYLLHRNVLKQPARGYYNSVPDNVPDYRIDPVFERKIHEGVMDRVTKK